MATANDWGEQSDDGLEAFTPLTADQAKALREASPPLSPWSVWRWQLLLGLVLVLGCWVFFDKLVAVSVAWGAAAVVLPGALFVRGVMRAQARTQPGVAIINFFVWELVKIILSVAIMVAAYKWVAGLNWLAMLAGLVLTLKVYWLALLIKPRRQTGTKHSA